MATEPLIELRHMEPSEYDAVRTWGLAVPVDDPEQLARRDLWIADNERGQAVGAVLGYEMPFAGNYQLEWAVHPEHRGQHYCRTMLRTLVALPRFAGRTLVATIEPENDASRRCAEAVGFELNEDDDLSYWIEPYPPGLSWPRRRRLSGLHRIGRELRAAAEDSCIYTRGSGQG
jgi:RimJ/RimL family protein N-acetyltransferase